MLSIQANLLMLDAEMGLNVWAAKIVRSRLWNGIPLSDLVGMVHELPTQLYSGSRNTKRRAKMPQGPAPTKGT
jgi:hypothetical protein